MRHHTTFRQLEIFEAIARLGSFTRAADELYLTQPTISMQMKKLADIVGVPLIEQVGKKIHLTDAGRELAQTCREVFGSMDRFTMSVADRQGLKKGRLALMAVSTASYFAPRLLGEFSKLYPGIDVSLKVTNREQVLAGMDDNLADLYILGQPPEDADVIAKAFMCNPLVILARPDHPLAGKQDIPLAELAKDPWLVRESGSGTRAAVERLFAEEGLEFRPRMALGSNEAIKQAILAGLGIAVMSTHSLTLNSPDQFAILKTKGFPICRQWYAVYPAGRQLSTVSRAFLEFLLSHERGDISCPGL
jgi:DNA-binding transcriptional LysR family regulator